MHIAHASPSNLFHFFSFISFVCAAAHAIEHLSVSPLFRAIGRHFTASFDGAPPVSIPGALSALSWAAESVGEAWEVQHHQQQFGGGAGLGVGETGGPSPVAKKEGNTLSITPYNPSFASPLSPSSTVGGNALV